MSKSTDQLHPELGRGELLDEELPPVRHVVADGLIEGLVEHASDALDGCNCSPGGRSLSAARFVEGVGDVDVVLVIARHALLDGGNGMDVELAQGGRVLGLDSASGEYTKAAEKALRTSM